MRGKTLLVAIGDPYTRTQWALARAAHLAARTGAKLELVHAFATLPPTLFGEPQPAAAQEFVGRNLRERTARLEKLAAPLRRRGLRVTATVVWDMPPHEALVRHVLKRKPALLVADSHRHARLARWFLTNVDWELIRHCPCPLWFVKTPRLRRRPRVLAAVDPSHAFAKPARLDERILREARRASAALGAQLRMCHAYLPPMFIGPPGALGESIPINLPPAEAKRYEDRLRAAVQRLARRHGVKAPLIEMGDAPSVLGRLARKLPADVLVMGAVSRSRLERVFIGSTAERVIDDVPCDVLIVKPARARSTVPLRPRRKLTIA
jgi:universal stress protein E